MRNYFLKADQLHPSDQIILFYQDRVLSKRNQILWKLEEIEYFLSEHSEFIVVEPQFTHSSLLMCRMDQDISGFLDAELKSLRSVMFSPGGTGLGFAGKANQLRDWYDSHQHCGRCGNRTTAHESSRALCCEPCNQQYFPRINPCVIMLIKHEDKVLLARSSRFNASFFSCLAGFIEPNESPEECVAREVMEEVGLKVRNIRYFKSQPWPFPSQLMLGFYADYDGGNITPDPEEIAEADWYSADNLPTVPSAAISVAGELIHNWIENPDC